MNIQGISNFTFNIKPLMKKLQSARKPETLTQAEMNQIVQYYLEVVDLLGKIESDHDIKEALS